MLGGILLNPKMIEVVQDLVEPVDLFSARHEHIYQAMLACHHNGKAPNELLVLEQLKANYPESVDLGYIASLSQYAPASSWAEDAALVVRDRAIRRDIIFACGDAAKLAYDVSRPLDEVLAEVQRAWTESIRSIGSDEAIDMEQATDEAYAVSTGEAPPTIETGWADYDHLLGGLYPEELIVIAARPSHGKSAAAGTLALNISQDGKSVHVISLEMSRVQFTQRLLSMLSGIDLLDLRKGDLSPDQLRKLAAAATTLRKLPILISDGTNQSIADIQAKVYRAARRRPIDVVIVDYIQYVEVNLRKGENLSTAIGRTSKGLKDIARNLKCSVIGLAQLNRDIERRSRSEWAPTMADLNESGKIEQDADVIMFIVRPELHDSETEKPGIAEIHIKKNRNGPTGYLELKFDGPTTKLSNLERWRTL